MGYILEFYECAHDIKSEILSEKFSIKIKKYFEQSSMNFEDYQKYNFESSMKNLMNLMDIGAEKNLDDEEALCLISSIRGSGKLLGGLDHASKSGKWFREYFLYKVVSKIFKYDNLGKNLMFRPIHDLIRYEYPSCGYLLRREVQKILVEDYDLSQYDSTTQEYLQEFHEILEKFRGGEYLYTIYT